MLHILVAESAGFPEPALRTLQQVGDVRLAEVPRGGLAQELGDANVLWVRLRHFVDGRIMDAAPGLRWIATPTTGLTHIDTQAATSRGIEIVCLRGRTDFLKDVRATAEMTVLLMLAQLRHLAPAAAHVTAGGWNRDMFRGGELFGRTVGLVGYGRLGRIVGNYLRAFGSRVLATDIRPVEAEAGVELVSLDELLHHAQVVSLHADYHPRNRWMWNAHCFERMQPGALFVNTARGELVDEAALLAALESGHLAGAALDVLDAEPPAGPDHPLVAYARRDPRLLLTPHIGGGTYESLEKAETFLAQTLAAVLSTAKEPLLCVESRQ